MTAPSSLGHIKDSGPVETVALAELETVEEPVEALVEPRTVEEPAMVEFKNTEVEAETVLPAAEELVEFDGRDSTEAKTIPGAYCPDN